MEDYFTVLAREIQGLQWKPGRLHQPVSEAGFDAWIKYYRGNEHSNNATISYYEKGHLLGMLLDILILDATAGRQGLDAVMLAMYQDYALDSKGYRNSDFQRTCERIAGRSFDDFFKRYVHGVEELPFTEVLGRAGLELDTTRSDRSFLGANLRERNGQVTVSFVLADGPAWKAGLNVGDELIAMDGYRVTDANVEYFKMRSPGDIVHLTVSRNGVLRDLVVTAGFKPEEISKVREMDEPSEAQLRLKAAWLRRP